MAPKDREMLINHSLKAWLSCASPLAAIMEAIADHDIDATQNEIVSVFMEASVRARS